MGLLVNVMSLKELLVTFLQVQYLKFPIYIIFKSVLSMSLQVQRKVI